MLSSSIALWHFKRLFSLVAIALLFFGVTQKESMPPLWGQTAIAEEIGREGRGDNGREEAIFYSRIQSVNTLTCIKYVYACCVEGQKFNVPH